jgi:hypothetical protein
MYILSNKMGGGLMQLVAYGAQDIYLTGNPQITFFKVVYRRHTNFSMEAIEQTINGTSTLGGGATTGTVTISRNGDLVGKVYVTSSTASIEDGDSLVSEVVLEIGGQQIDKHTKEWMQIWAELSTPDSKALAYKNMTGALSHGLNTTGTTGVGMVQVPLQFYFCRNPGLALPLIALQYHEVKLKFTWGTSAAAGAAAVCKVWCDYIYLDTEERRRFAQVSHEYLIEQLQYQEEGSASSKIKLNFNHPVKEIIWTGDSYTDAKITLNGHDRFTAQEEEYFQLRQPMDHHTAVPGYNIPMNERSVLLSTPVNVSTVMLTNEADTSPSDGGMSVVANVLYLHADEAQSGFAVGDILHIKELDLNADAAASFDVYCHITVVTSTTQFTLNSCPATVAGAFGSVSKIGSHQSNLSRCSQLASKVNVYSFALKPEEHQPSGTCNFSRIDTAYLQTSANVTPNIYAVNYNVLRVMSGMGGLAYSN